MRKKVIVACAGAVATSTMAAAKIKELCKKNGIDVEICQVRISEIETHLTGASLVVTTGRLKKDFGVPYVPGMAFISGIGEEQTEEKILEILK
ncbi:PTS galactitol transporter subunit IIB [Blautia sp. Sow4_E7]|uniref:PTS galactitol transporter subunit IIB n=1 Tax=Blautia sp. Sow4_E7 TaxID=3438749 RepID=UPI003F92673D